MKRINLYSHPDYKTEFFILNITVRINTLLIVIGGTSFIY